MKFFIVPYRNRNLQKKLFIKHFVRTISGEYKILFIHQKDNRTFNRGAMKNIGFLYVKHVYPQIYKNSTFIFQDISYAPRDKIFSYDTKVGEIKHFFGFKFALGGAFAIKGQDFEKIGGFPNYWGWGFEDNAIQRRAQVAKIKINYDEFIHDKSKLYFFNKLQSKHRIIGKNNARQSVFHPLVSNMYDITNTKYDKEDVGDFIQMVNVSHFKTKMKDDLALLKYKIPPRFIVTSKISTMSEIMAHKNNH